MGVPNIKEESHKALFLLIKTCFTNYGGWDGKYCTNQKRKYQGKIAAAANKVAENLIQESKNKNFDIRNFARKRGYDLTSAKLNGIILGEKGASLKIMSGVYERSIFAIMKDGKILWAKGYALGRHYLKLTLEKLCQKGKISEDELTFCKKTNTFVILTL